VFLWCVHIYVSGSAGVTNGSLSASLPLEGAAVSGMLGCLRVPGAVCHVCVHDSSSVRLERFAGDSSGSGGHGSNHICVCTSVSAARAGAGRVQSVTNVSR